ncbi:phage shock protein A [Candidatus Magnetomoraceae bacterium gMMP-15]
MTVLKRLSNVVRAEAHALIDKLEDPIKIMELGIIDLKKDLKKSMDNLAKVKAIAIKIRNDADKAKKLAEDYEKKALNVLKKTQNKELNEQEADRLATESLIKKEEVENNAARLAQDSEKHDQLSKQFQASVNNIKSKISKYEKDLEILKAKSGTAVSGKKVNEQLAELTEINSSNTIEMIEKMKAKVEQDELLAQAYEDIVNADKSVDNEINTALESDLMTTASQSLLELKKKLGIIKE